LYPPTLILAAEYDPLRDETMDYAEKLSSQGIAVSARIEPGLVHAFCNLSGVLPQGGLRAFDDAVAEMNTRMRRSDRDGIS
jgi:acetyl esterase